MVIHLGRRLPNASCGRPEGGATHPCAARATRALLFGLAPGRACPFHPVGRSRTDSSLWRWSAPRGGRELPATSRRGARTFLGRRVAPPHATIQPSHWPTDSTTGARRWHSADHGGCAQLLARWWYRAGRGHATRLPVAVSGPARRTDRRTCCTDPVSGPPRHDHPVAGPKRPDADVIASSWPTH